MNAFVSGSANVAVVVEGDSLWSLRRTISGVDRLPRQPHDLRYVLGDARDLAFLEDVDEAAVLAELDLAHAGVQALHLALMLCDPQTSERAAGLGVGELEALLARREVAERAERILDAKPMPAPFDARIAVARCRVCSGAGAVAFFEALAARQPTICEVRRAWDVLPSSLFAGGEERATADGLMAREGLFRSFVRAREGGANLDAWLTAALREPAVIRSGAERWVEAWAASLRDLVAPVEVAAAQPDITPRSGLSLLTFLSRNPRALARAQTIAREVARRGQVMEPAAA